MREVSGTGGCGSRQDTLWESVVKRVPSSRLCISICHCLKSPVLKMCSVPEVNIQRACAAESVLFIVTRHGWSERITIMCIVVLLRMSLPVLWYLYSARYSSLFLIFIYVFISPYFSHFPSFCSNITTRSCSFLLCSLREQRPKKKTERDRNNKNRKEMHAEWQLLWQEDSVICPGGLMIEGWKFSHD